MEHYIETDRDVLLAALRSVYGDNCFYCDRILLDDVECTVDHFIPKVECRRRGWSSTQTHGIANLRLACKPCNASKGDRVPNEDGTLPPKANARTQKLPRPETCDTCMNGRLLLVGEECPDCLSGPQPITAPKYLQRKPKECDHAMFHCFMCFTGIIPRKSERIGVAYE